jgi:hypothetical protein
MIEPCQPSCQADPTFVWCVRIACSYHVFVVCVRSCVRVDTVYAEGVTFRSPGSRSAPRGMATSADDTPKALDNAF